MNNLRFFCRAWNILWYVFAAVYLATFIVYKQPFNSQACLVLFLSLIDGLGMNVLHPPQGAIERHFSSPESWFQQ
jgi:hypothetical protein